ASLEQERRGIYADAMRHVGAMVDATKRFLGFWTDKSAVRDVVREIHGVDTGNAAAKKAAHKWLDASELLRKQYNEMGGNIRKLSYGYLPQLWSQVKLAKISAEQFIGEILPRLNRDRYRNENGTRMTDDQ